MRAHLYSQHTALHHSCSWWVAGATGGAIARKSPSSHATHPRTFRRDLHARIFSRLAMRAHLYSQHTALHHSCSWWVAGATGGAIAKKSLKPCNPPTHVSARLARTYILTTCNARALILTAHCVAPFVQLVGGRGDGWRYRQEKSLKPCNPPTHVSARLARTYILTTCNARALILTAHCVAPF